MQALVGIRDVDKSGVTEDTFSEVTSLCLPVTTVKQYMSHIGLSVLTCVSHTTGNSIGLI